MKIYGKAAAAVLLVLFMFATACGPATQRVELASPKPGKGAQGFKLYDEVIFTSDNCFESDFKFPYTGYANVDRQVKDEWMDKYYKDTVKEFRQVCRDGGGGRQFLGMDYESFAPSDKALSFLFMPWVDTGGAHPMHDAGTMSFSLPQGKRLGYQDIFEDTGALYQFLSSYVSKLLEPKYGDIWQNLPDFAEGVGPSRENFKNFVLTPDGITLIFPPYQIAPYSEGMIRCDVPLSELERFRPRMGVWH